MDLTAEQDQGHVLHRLLVVEDVSSIREFYRQFLTEAGYEIDLAADGEEGWESARARSYSLIITDHDMPRLCGLGLIRRLNQIESEIPVILVSGSLSPDDPRLLGLGHFALVAKPFSVASLLATVRSVLLLIQKRQHSPAWEKGVGLTARLDVYPTALS